MTWFAISANEAEAAKEHVHLFVAVDFDFPSGHARLWSGVGDLTIGGNVFTGAGDLGSITFPVVKSGLSILATKTYQLAHADLNPAIVSESDIDNCFGRPVIEYFGFLNPDTKQLIAEPESNWEGSIDSIKRTDGSAPAIEITAEHRLLVLDKSSNQRFTHEDQQRFYAGDTGFKFLPASLNREIVWGGIIVFAGGAAGPGRNGGTDRGGNPGISPGRQLAPTGR